MKSKIEKNMEKSVRFYVYKAFKIVFFIILGLSIAFLVGYIVMRLWNWLMPDIFGLPAIDYWKAVGILLLSKIIFGFGGGSSHSKHKKNKKRFNVNPCSSMRKLNNCKTLETFLVFKVSLAIFASHYERQN